MHTLGQICIDTLYKYMLYVLHIVESLPYYHHRHQRHYCYYWCWRCSATVPISLALATRTSHILAHESSTIHCILAVADRFISMFGESNECHECIRSHRGGIHWTMLLAVSIAVTYLYLAPHQHPTAHIWCFDSLRLPSGCIINPAYVAITPNPNILCALHI